MKIRITSDIPVRQDFRPPIGSIHDVIDEARLHNRLYYIVYKGERVGIYPRECEILREE